MKLRYFLQWIFNFIIIGGYIVPLSERKSSKFLEQVCLAVCSQCTLSLTPISKRKPYGFLMFSGGRERAHWE